MTSIYRSTFAALLTVFFVTAYGKPGTAAELIMYESQGCQWCEAWDEEVGIIYAKTEEGKVLPLRRIDADSDMPEDLAEINGLVYTPTFVAWDRGQEIGRIIGYPGESFFWAQLNELVGRLERGQSAGN